MRTMCGKCGKAFETQRMSAKFCSQRCRTAAYEARKRGQVVELPPVEQPADTIEAQSRAVLLAAGRLATPLGAAVVRMSRILDASQTMQGWAALMQQWRVTLEAALAGVTVEADEVDELRAWRDRQFAG